MLRSRARGWLLVAALVAASCSGGDGDGDPPAATVETPTSRASTTTTADALTPEQEVEAAYLRSWDVYAKAVRELDPSGLEESYTGDALETVRKEVERYASARTPVRVGVDHDYAVQVLANASAVVIDNYTNHSVFVDPDTGRPTEEDTAERVTEIYTLREEEGRWKVASIVRR